MPKYPIVVFLATVFAGPLVTGALAAELSETKTYPLPVTVDDDLRAAKMTISVRTREYNQRLSVLAKDAKKGSVEGVLATVVESIRKQDVAQLRAVSASPDQESIEGELETYAPTIKALGDPVVRRRFEVGPYLYYVLDSGEKEGMPIPVLLKQSDGRVLDAFSSLMDTVLQTRPSELDKRECRLSLAAMT